MQIPSLLWIKVKPIFLKKTLSGFELIGKDTQQNF